MRPDVAARLEMEMSTLLAAWAERGIRGGDVIGAGADRLHGPDDLDVRIGCRRRLRSLARQERAPVNSEAEPVEHAAPCWYEERRMREQMAGWSVDDRSRVVPPPVTRRPGCARLSISAENQNFADT